MRAAACVLALVGPLAAAAEPTPERQEQIVRLVRQDCGSCHGMKLTGGLGPALTREALAHKPVASMAATIRHGRPGTPMPPWTGRLSEAEEDALGVRFVLLPELLRTADVVSLHVPLDDSTRHMVGAAELAQMKPGAILINTCRGPVVDEAALYEALKAGRPAAAGLDVLVEEPPAKDHPLFTLPNVTLTPHSAGPTWENWTARFRNGFDNIQRVAAGRAPKWVIPELQS